MRALWPSVNRWLVWFHRWAGVALCLLVVAWFVSGAILHFVPYPALPRADQIAHSEAITLSLVRVAPESALSRLPPVSDLRLLSVAGRPVYVGHTALDKSVGVAADTGEVLPPLPAETARKVAEHFAGAAAIGVTGPLAYDQWIVHQRFDQYRPLFRVRINDADRTDLYVSAATGEVVQRTRFVERAWNWPGAVLHWLYFTPLRRSWSAWNQVVWWLSLVTLLSATAGIWLGILRLIANRVAGRKGLSPFRGWMRWHHVIGLFASVIVLFWIFSGWLSMDHGRIFSKGQPTRQQTEQVRGLSLPSAAAAASLESVRNAGPATRIGVHAIAGRAFLAVQSNAGSHLVWLGSGNRTVADLVPDELLLVALRAAWPGAVLAAVDSSDETYRLAESLPESARAFLAPNEGSTRIYLDPGSVRS